MHGNRINGLLPVSLSICEVCVDPTVLSDLCAQSWGFDTWHGSIAPPPSPAEANAHAPPKPVRDRLTKVGAAALKEDPGTHQRGLFGVIQEGGGCPCNNHFVEQSTAEMCVCMHYHNRHLH
jgi:hypothetical protein